MSDILYGIDISHHNDIKTVEIIKTARDGFVMLKATEGKTFIDQSSLYRANHIVNAMTVDVAPYSFGFYHYCRPEIGNSPYTEALHFVRTISKYIGSAVLPIDVEQKALEYSNLDRWVLSWLRSVETMTGVKPLVYCQRSALKLLPSAATNDYGLWLAAWGKQRPKTIAPWKLCAMWQYSAVGVDKDIFYGGKEQFLKYAEVR